MKKFTHLDTHGKAIMVDVSGKKKSLRRAEASADILISEELFKMIAENKIKKGDVFTVSKIAGILAAKRTSDLIPLCHNIPLSKIDIKFKSDQKHFKIKIICTAVTEEKTGVEMEALTGAAIAALTIYDMCKAVDKSIVVSELKLLTKSGGKSGDYTRKK